MNQTILQLLPFVIGPVVALLTEWGKKAPIPFEGKSTTGLIVVLGILSSVLTVVLEVAIAYYSGNLAAYDWNRAVNVLIEAGKTLFVAAGAFGLYKKATAV
jgi:hypothetical protein